MFFSSLPEVSTVALWEANLGPELSNSQVKNILHYDPKTPQAYLVSPSFSNKQSSLLFNLRSQCVNEFKSNFFY